MRRRTKRLLVLISGLTLLSATVESSYSEQGCRGCDVRTAETINRDANRETPSQPPEKISQLDQIVKKYEREKEKHDLIKNAQLLFGLTVDEVVSEIGNVFPPLSGVPSIFVSGGEILARFTAAKVLLHFSEEMDKSSRATLADRLARYRQEHNGNFQGLLDAYHKGEIPHEGAFRLLFGEHPVYDTGLDDVRPEDQHVVNKFLIRALADSVGQGMDGINNLLRQHDAAIAANRVDIDKNRRNLTKLSQAFNRYIDEADKRFSRLESNQRKLHEAITENRDDIKSVQVILFNTLTPEQQRQALEGGFFRDMPDAHREALEREIQDAANQQEILEALEDVIWISRGIGELVHIAQNLGVDEEIIEPAMVAVEVGISVAVAIASFETGQIPQGIAATLHGIAALTRLFAGDKPDAVPDAVIENQKRLMEMLRAVMGGLEHIDQKLDQLFDNQRRVMANQRKIYDLMVEIGKDIQAKHEDLADRIYSLNADVLVNRALIRERVEERVRVCDGMRRDYANESVYNEIQGNLEGFLKYELFPDYQGIQSIVQASNPINNGCYEQLFGIFPDNNDSLHSYFELETYKREPSDITPDHRINVEKIGNFLGLIYNPSVQLVDHYYTVDLDLSRQQLLSVLSLPVTGLQALDRKHDRAKHLPPSESYPFEALKFEDLEDALSPDAVLKAVWLMLDIYPLYHFVDNEGSLLPIDTLKELAHDGALPNTPGKKWLEQAKDVVEVAITQQALLAGDMLLPVIYEKLHRASSTRDQEQLQSIRLLLRKNPLLARNFMLYLVHRQLKEKLSILAYDTAIMEGSLTDHQKRDMLKVLRILYRHGGGPHLSTPASDWSLIDEWLAEQIRPIQQQIQSVRQSLNELDRTDIGLRSERSNDLYAPDGIRAYLVDDQFYQRLEDLKKTWYETGPRDLSGIYNVDLSRVVSNVLMTHKDNNILRTFLINQWLQERYRHVHQVTGREVQSELLSFRIELESNYPFKDERPTLEPESEACQPPEGSLAPPHRPHAQFHLTKPIWLNPVYQFPPAPSFICDEEHHYPHCASCFLLYSGEIDNRMVGMLGSTYADGDNLRTRWRRRLLTSAVTLQGDVHKRLLDQLDAWLSEEESMEGVRMAMSHDGAGVWVSEPEPGAGRRFERYTEFMSHGEMNARVKALTDEGLRQEDTGLLQIDAWLKEQYRLALANNDEYTLRLILDESVRYAELVRHAFEQDGNRVEKWAIKWGDDLYLPLPEADDLIEGKLLHTREMSKLIELRSYVIEEIIGRRFVGNEDGLLDDGEHQLFNDLLFLRR